MAETSFAVIADGFSVNLKAVDRLLDFDRVIIDVAVEGLQELAVELEQQHSRRRAATTIRNRAKLLTNIKSANSLRPQYETIFNQCVVLLISYFTSAIHTLFRQGIVIALSKGADVPVMSEELKLSWRTMAQSEAEREAVFADLLVTQQNISFQDMQSISRAFKEHLNIQLKRSVDTNNIILGQAARHVIVHAGSIIDKKMIRQVAGCIPRTLKQELELGDRLQFNPQEIRVLSQSMIVYVNDVTSALNVALEDEKRAAYRRP
jgi:hypothetical protein